MLAITKNATIAILIINVYFAAYIFAAPKAELENESEYLGFIGHGGYYEEDIRDLHPGTHNLAFRNIKCSYTEDIPPCWGLRAGDYYITHTINYPQDTGHEKVDEFLAAKYDRLKGPDEESIRGIYARLGLKGSALEFENAKDICLAIGSSERYFGITTYFLFKPSDGYLSAVFYDYGYANGAHDNWSYHVFNFNLKTGEMLTGADLFPDLEQSLPKFLEYQTKKWCEKYPGRSPCQPFLNEPRAVYNHELTNFAFSEKGLSVILSPYELGSFGDGTRVIDLPKEELIALGADPKFWD